MLTSVIHNEIKTYRLHKLTSWLTSKYDANRVSSILVAPLIEFCDS
jgi:hypothetical protein